MLVQLKQAVEEAGALSLAELSARSGAAPAAVRGMMEHWIRKGLIRRRSGASLGAGAGGKCGSCASSGGCGAAGAAGGTGCSAAMLLEIYEVMPPL